MFSEKSCLMRSAALRLYDQRVPLKSTCWGFRWFDVKLGDWWQMLTVVEAFFVMFFVTSAVSYAGRKKGSWCFYGYKLMRLKYEIHLCCVY